MNNIPISFLVPCYNCSKTIKQTINSILNLRLEKFEICLVDDCSKDNTYEILQSYKQKFPDIININKNDVNIGGGANRNKCFEMSKYDYIFMLDSDNILDKDSFYNLLNNINVDDNLITFGIIKFFYSLPFNLRLCYKDLVFLKTKMTFQDLRKTLIHPVVDGNYLYKRKVFEDINGYDTDFGAMDTWSFGYKALLKGYEYKIIKDACYLHRVNRGSYWFRESEKNFENLRRLLLRYPNNFTVEELAELNTCSNVTDFLIKDKNNDFVVEKIGIVYKIYNKFNELRK